MPGSGLAIWHIDESQDKVTLVQADNNWDIENGINKGDAGDLYTTINNFTNDTIPDSKFYNGSKSGLSITNIGTADSNDVITAKLSTDTYNHLGVTESIPDEWEWTKMKEAYEMYGDEVELALGDYDGDKRTDRAMVIKSTGQWFIIPSSIGREMYLDLPIPPQENLSIPWGWEWKEMKEAYERGDKIELAHGDYDDDNKADPAMIVYSADKISLLYVSSEDMRDDSIQNVVSQELVWPDMNGNPETYELALGNYDKDGITDWVMVDKSTFRWYVLSSETKSKGIIGRSYIPELPWGWEWSNIKGIYENSKDEIEKIDLVIEDYDSDHIPDKVIVFHYKSGTPSKWFGLGSKENVELSAPNGSILFHNMTSEYDVITGIYYDDDRIPDPTICHRIKGTCSVFGTVDMEVVISDWSYPHWDPENTIMAIGDYYRDGKSDTAIVNKSTGKWYITNLIPFKGKTIIGKISITGEVVENSTRMTNYDSPIVADLKLQESESPLETLSKQSFAAAVSTVAENELKLVITSPSGKVYTPTSEGVMDYYKDNGQEYYVIDSDEQGNWSFDVVGVNVGPDGVSYELNITDNPVADFATNHIVVGTTQNQIFVHSLQGEAELNFTAIGNQVTTTDSDNDELDEIAVTDGNTISVYEFDGNDSDPNTLQDNHIFQVFGNVDIYWGNKAIVGLKDENTIVIDDVSIPVFEEFANQTRSRATRKGKSKVTLCHKGQTKSLPEPAVKAHLGHGDTLGACTSTPDDKKITVCHIESDSIAYNITISTNALSAHLEHGDTKGKCPSEPPPDEKITICHVPSNDINAAYEITIPIKELDEHLEHGDTKGKCPSEPPPHGEIYGVNVAAGDLNNDGIDEIIAAMASKGGYIEIYTGDGQLLNTFNTQFTNGVIVTTGDVNGDGMDDIIAGDANGTEIQIFDIDGNSIGNTFSVATGNITSLAFGKGILTDPSEILAREFFKSSDNITPNSIETTTSLPIVAPPPLTGSIETSYNYGGQTLSDADVESGTSISQVELEGEISSEGLISNATILPNTTFSGGKMTGYIINNGTISDIEFVGAELTGGYLSGVIIVNSDLSLGLGILRDVTILPETRIVGGILAGNIDNQGTLIDVIIEADAIITGGILEGVIQNDGLLQDVTLAEETLIHGGFLSGNVIGNVDNPALIKDVEVLENTILENVIVDEVEIGERVFFEN